MAQTIICPKHGGPWGTDETCVACTMADGTPMPLEPDPEQAEPEYLELHIWLKADPEHGDFDYLTEVGRHVQQKYGSDLIGYEVIETD